MKKLILVLMIMLFNTQVFGKAFVTSNKENHYAYQSGAVLPTDVKWAVIKDDKYVSFNNAELSYCKNINRSIFEECIGKKMTVDEYVKMYIPDANIIGMTPHFDRFGKMIFMVVYYKLK